MTTKYASRAGEKLAHAIEKFNVDVKGKTIADFGSSTGGFVDMLIKNGAEKVYSVDTAYGELDWNLRNNDRVVVMERTNAMHVKLPEKADLITIDVSWTKQKNILPNAFANLKPKGRIISLIKPHYEADEKHIKKGKLDDSVVNSVLEQTRKDIYNAGGKILVETKSPILGEKGRNEEYLFLIESLS